ncbi:MAG: hypothetical protein ACOY3P_17430 [Planctomycetota bacterium]
MLTVLTRAIVPVLLLAGGIALMAFGSLWNSVPVVEEREEEKTIEVPQPFSPPPFAPPGMGPGGPGPSFMPPPPPPIRKTVKVLLRTTTDTREPQLVREITFGGVIRLANGELKRTYTGHAPSLCPT